MIRFGLSRSVAILVISQVFAAQKKSNASRNQPMMYYRNAPAQTYYRVPFSYSVSQGGIYHNDVLLNGTVTGPLGPDNPNGG
jgi:hypothetical protein